MKIKRHRWRHRSGVMLCTRCKLDQLTALAMRYDDCLPGTCRASAPGWL